MKLSRYFAFLSTTMVVAIASPLSISTPAHAQVQSHYGNCMDEAFDSYLSCMGGAAIDGVVVGGVTSMSATPAVGSAAGMTTFAVESLQCAYELMQNQCDEAGPAQPMTHQSGAYHNTGHWEGIPGVPNNYDWINDENPGDMVFMENGDIWERQ